MNEGVTLPPHLQRMRDEWESHQITDEIQVSNDAASQESKPPSKIRDRWLLFNRLIDTEQRRLTDSEFRVLMTLFRDSKNGITRSAQSDVARRTGKCRGTVSRAVKRLVAKNLLGVIERGGVIGHEGKQKVSRYQIKNSISHE